MMVKQAATGREHVTATVAQHTRARIEAFCRVTGLSRGRLIDLAIDALDVCKQCDGKGQGEAHACGQCGGDGVVLRLGG